QQRLALARAMAVKPRLLLLDEAFSALDAPTRYHAYDCLRAALAGRTATVLLVTHNLEEALFLARHVFVFGPRPGRVVQRFVVESPGGTFELQKEVSKSLRSRAV